MRDVLEGLKGLDTEAIVQRTKISHSNIVKMLGRDFGAFKKVQFFGFISILEREYRVDLHSLREEYLEASALEQPTSLHPEYFLGAPRKRSLGKLWGIALLFLVGLVVYMLLPQTPQTPHLVLPETEHPLIVKAKEQLEAARQQESLEENNTQYPEPIMPEKMEVQSGILEPETNATLQEEQAVAPIVTAAEKVMTPTPSNVEAELVLIPSRRLWLGIIDMDDGTKIQTVTQDPYEINATKRWRMVLGHGYVEVRINGETKTYQTPEKLWLAYENGRLDELDAETFRQQNGGKSW